MTRTETRRIGRICRAITAAIALAVIAGLAAVCVIAKPWTLIGRMTDTGRTASAAKVDVTTLRTQPVTKGVLNAETRLGGTLQYDDASDFQPSTGVITQLPTPGAEINTGQQVYEMDGVPVPLFHGARPFWRTLQVDVPDGPDVTQLEENLQELGYFRAAPNSHFDWRTREAVRQWQAKSLGLKGEQITGTFDPGSVALVPTAPIRIKTVTAKLGDKETSPGSYTGTALHVEATLTATQAATFKAGDKVRVVMPNNTTIDTALAAVDQGGQSTGKDGQVTSPSARVDFPDQSQAASFGTTSVQLVIPNTAVANGTATGESLIVPVTAIIASAGNTYAIDVVRGDGLKRIPVEIGLVANAQAQLTKADGLKEGDKVVVS
ncbi:peptidoglycan-binding protein [Bifidobacterium sp. MA2]|uniref:Peptidoglycan-binding protein n=1 Tax=Bifidobacterium santillanense TaxID=2809028 RepID=A0ABS5UM37_9BIFI|nr:peptidoglycan-binding protein [Bifidobacterium santillanense]MBT1171968.1 peptidoglycan-binding protein [Bifidobacterium santillanense]